MKVFLYVLFTSMVFATDPVYAASQVDAKFDAIQNVIQDYEAAHPGETLSIPRVLAILPERFRSGFTLMHTSRSAQGASPENPRVIMFGDDARTILTFNGDGTQASGNKLEFVSVNDKTGKLEFRFMEFPENDSTTGRVEFSQVNPPRCLACHGQNPHYIWGDYARWPGAFGSLDDVLELSEGEQANLRKFLASASQHPRYKALKIEFQSLSENAPYRTYVSGDRASRGSYQQAIEVRPNARLSMLLNKHLARARVAEIMEATEFENYKFGLAFHLAGCTEFVSPNEIERKTGLKDAEDFAKKLGNSPEDGWHMQLRSKEIKFTHFYYSGFWTLDSLLSYFLWSQTLAQDPKWQSYFVPLGIADALDNLSYKFFAGERGKEMFRTMDREGLAPKDFKGSDELKHWVAEAKPGQTKIPMKKLCEELSQAQPEVRRLMPPDLSRISYE